MGGYSDGKDERVWGDISVLGGKFSKGAYEPSNLQMGVDVWIVSNTFGYIKIWHFGKGRSRIVN